MSLINDALGQLGVKTKVAEPNPNFNSNSDESGSANVNDIVLRLRVGGFDLRKQVFKGWVLVERFEYRGAFGSFCVMQRDQVRKKQI